MDRTHRTLRWQRPVRSSLRGPLLALRRSCPARPGNPPSWSPPTRRSLAASTAAAGVGRGAASRRQPREPRSRRGSAPLPRRLHPSSAPSCPRWRAREIRPPSRCRRGLRQAPGPGTRRGATRRPRTGLRPPQASGRCAPPFVEVRADSGWTRHEPREGRTASCKHTCAKEEGEPVGAHPKPQALTNYTFNLPARTSHHENTRERWPLMGRSSR